MPLDIEAGVRETATGYLCLEDILQFRALFPLSLADFIDLKRPLHPALEREELELLKNLLALRLHHQPILMRTVQQGGFKSPNAVYAALRQRARPMVIDLRSQPRGYTRSAAAAAVQGNSTSLGSVICAALQVALSRAHALASISSFKASGQQCIPCRIRCRDVRARARLDVGGHDVHDGAVAPRHKVEVDPVGPRPPQVPGNRAVSDGVPAKRSICE